MRKDQRIEPALGHHSDGDDRLTERHRRN